jgi:hypothetical protein
LRPNRRAKKQERAVEILESIRSEWLAAKNELEGNITLPMSSLSAIMEGQDDCNGQSVFEGCGKSFGDYSVPSSAASDDVEPNHGRNCVGASALLDDLGHVGATRTFSIHPILVVGARVHLESLGTDGGANGTLKTFDVAEKRCEITLDCGENVFELDTCPRSVGFLCFDHVFTGETVDDSDEVPEELARAQSNFNANGAAYGEVDGYSLSDSDEVPAEHARAQSNFSTNVAALGEVDGYFLSEEPYSLEVLVKVPKGTTMKDVKVEFRTQEIRVIKPVTLPWLKLGVRHAYLKLYYSADGDVCHWTVGDGQIVITLVKCGHSLQALKARPWSQLISSEEAKAEARSATTNAKAKAAADESFARNIKFLSEFYTAPEAMRVRVWPPIAAESQGARDTVKPKAAALDYDDSDVYAAPKAKRVRLWQFAAETQGSRDTDKANAEALAWTIKAKAKAATAEAYALDRRSARQVYSEVQAAKARKVNSISVLDDLEEID